MNDVVEFLYCGASLHRVKFGLVKQRVEPCCRNLAFYCQVCGYLLGFSISWATETIQHLAQSIWLNLVCLRPSGGFSLQFSKPLCKDARNQDIHSTSSKDISSITTLLSCRVRRRSLWSRRVCHLSPAGIKGVLVHLRVSSL